MRSLARAASPSVRDVEDGFAVLNDALPAVWHLNFVWIDVVPVTLTAPAVEKLADALLGGAGLAHREVLVADESGGEHLAPELEELGWSPIRRVLMAHNRRSDRTAERGLAGEADDETRRTFSLASLRDDENGYSEDTIRQLVDAGDVRRPWSRFFSATMDGEPAAGCDLYLEDGVGQIESVVTRPAFRNRGLGRGVVLTALEAAREARCELVFLEAEEDDWPKELYAKLGFDPIGRTWLFRKAPAL